MLFFQFSCLKNLSSLYQKRVPQAVEVLFAGERHDNRFRGGHALPVSWNSTDFVGFIHVWVTGASGHSLTYFISLAFFQQNDVENILVYEKSLVFFFLIDSHIKTIAKKVLILQVSPCKTVMFEKLNIFIVLPLGGLSCQKMKRFNGFYWRS